jgi:hypothetical protein
MRKALWIPALAIALVPFAAQAQSAEWPWKWGVIGGINLSNITRENATDTKLDFDAGLTLQKPMTAIWSFNIEAHYSMKGIKWTEAGTTRTLSLDYIDMPILFRAGKSTGDVKPFIEFGATPALNVSCKVKAEDGTTNLFNECSNSKITTADVGLVGGAGFEINALGRPWTIGSRYTLGMVNVNDQGAGKNTNVQFLLGMRFR